MAFHTVEDGPWPSGTTVAVWPTSAVSGGVPSGPPLDTAVAGPDGTATFGDLVEGQSYTAFGHGGLQEFEAINEESRIRALEEHPVFDIPLGNTDGLQVWTENPFGRFLRFRIEGNQDTQSVDIVLSNATVEFGQIAYSSSRACAVRFLQPAAGDGGYAVTNLLNVYKPGSNTQKVMYVNPNGGIHLGVGGLSSLAFVIYSDGDANNRYEITELGSVRFGPGGATGATWGRFHGTGSPEGVVTASPGSTYHRRDGGAGTSFYVKESGSGNTGWVAK